MNSITQLVSGNIVLARRMARLKQSELAALLGVTTQSISEWERGNTDPSHKKLEAMGQALALTGSGLWFYQDHTKETLKSIDVQAIQESREDLFKRFLEFEKRTANGGLPLREDTDEEAVNFCELPLRTPAQSAEFVLSGQKHRTKDLLGIIQMDDSHNPRNLYHRAK